MDAGRLDWLTLRAIGREAGQLTRTLATLAGQERNANYDRYRLAATCPPSTSVHVRGGTAWETGYGSVTVAPSATLNLTAYNTTRRNSQFTIAYAYTFYWISYSTSGGYLFVGGGNAAGWWQEYETAVAAEQGAMAPDCYQLHNWPPWDYGILVGCLILRNDGNLTLPNQFLPIDPVNRGRSYIFRNRDTLLPASVT